MFYCYYKPIRLEILPYTLILPYTKQKDLGWYTLKTVTRGEQTGILYPLTETSLKLIELFHHAQALAQVRKKEVCVALELALLVLKVPKRNLRFYTIKKE